MNGWQSLGFKYYTDYLLSDIWKERKQIMLGIFKECQLCGKPKIIAGHYYEYWDKLKKKMIEIKRSSYTEKLIVHHKTYYNVGNEDEGDLMVVCNDCHNEIHKEKEG